MIQKRIRIGVVGAGANTRAKHLPLLKQIPGVEIVAVANRTRDSAERVAQEFAIERVETEVAAVIGAEDIDAVVIGTWPYLHAELSVAALRAGKHVLTEARMASNLSEAQQMWEESERHPGLAAQIVPAPFSLPFDATVVGWLDQGRLGEVREVHATCTHGAWANPNAPFSWRQDFELSGKNTLFLGIYYEMVRRWMRRDPVSVVADAAVFSVTRRDEMGRLRDVHIPESVTALGRYADGARLVMHCSGVETSAGRSEIRLNGTAGSLRADFATNELWFAAVGEAERRVDIEPELRGEWRVEEDFIGSIRTGAPVRLTDFAAGVRYMAFTEAVWDSWSSGGRRTEVR